MIAPSNLFSTVSRVILLKSKSHPITSFFTALQKAPLLTQSKSQSPSHSPQSPSWSAYRSPLVPCCSWNTPGAHLPQGFALPLILSRKLFSRFHWAHSSPSSLSVNLIFSMRLTLTSLFKTVIYLLPTHPVPSQHPWSCPVCSTSFLSTDVQLCNIPHNYLLFFRLFYIPFPIPIHPQPESKLQRQGSLSPLMKWPKYLLDWMGQFLRICASLPLAGLGVIFYLL